MTTVHCKTHGKQPATYVCQHLVEGLIAKRRVGFHWSVENPANPRTDARCTACNDRVAATDWEWIGEALEHLQPKILCGECYDLAKTLHTGGDPWN